MKAYRAKNKRTGEMLKSSKGRTIWLQKGHLTRTREYIYDREDYEIIEYILVPTDEYKLIYNILEALPQPIEIPTQFEVL